MQAEPTNGYNEHSRNLEPTQPELDRDNETEEAVKQLFLTPQGRELINNNRLLDPSQEPNLGTSNSFGPDYDVVGTAEQITKDAAQMDNNYNPVKEAERVLENAGDGEDRHRLLEAKKAVAEALRSNGQ